MFKSIILLHVDLKFLIFTVKFVLQLGVIFQFLITIIIIIIIIIVRIDFRASYFLFLFPFFPNFRRLKIKRW